MNGTRAHFPGPLAALLISLAAVFSAGLVIGLFGPEPDIGSLGVGEAIGFGLVATLAARRVPAPQRERLGLCGFDPTFVPLLALLIPVVVVQSELDNLISAALPPLEVSEAARDLENGLEPVTMLDVIQQVIAVVGIAPVVEEWLFRGVIQQGLVARLGRLRGVLLTSALFALAHASPAASGAHALSPLVNSLILGAVLGALRLATGSLLAPMLLAGSVNAVVLAAVGLGERLPIPGFNAPGDHTPLSVLLPAVFAVCWALTVVGRRASRAPVALPIPERDA